MRETADVVEQLGVARAQAAAQQAGLVIVVLDASAPLEDADHTALEAARRAPRSVLVYNKSDRGEMVQCLETDDFPYQVSISAKTGEGLEPLRRTLLDCAGLTGAAFDGGLITNARQAAALDRAATACARAHDALSAGITPDAILLDVEEAIAALGELTGQQVREDVIADIFSRFCVGK